MNTVVGSFYTITACSVKTLRETGASSWTARNSTQERFLRIFDVCKRDVDHISEIESEVGVGTVDPVNTFLRRKNLDIQLRPISPQELVVASVLDFLVEWLHEGQPSTLLHDVKEYPAVLLNRGVRVFMVNTFPHPVATITSHTNDIVFMTILSEQPTSAFEVFERARTLVEKHASAKAAWTFKGVKFPMIDLDVQPDIAWLIGMRANGWWIGQALQQTKLKLNERGAHVTEAVAVTAKVSVHVQAAQPLLIDQPFLLVVQRPGLTRPLFSAFLAEDCWKDPGRLAL